MKAGISIFIPNRLEFPGDDLLLLGVTAFCFLANHKQAIFLHAKERPSPDCWQWQMCQRLTPKSPLLSLLGLLPSCPLEWKQAGHEWGLTPVYVGGWKEKRVKSGERRGRGTRGGESLGAGALVPGPVPTPYLLRVLCSCEVCLEPKDKGSPAPPEWSGTGVSRWWAHHWCFLGICCVPRPVLQAGVQDAGGAERDPHAAKWGGDGQREVAEWGGGGLREAAQRTGSRQWGWMGTPPPKRWARSVLPVLVLQSLETGRRSSRNRARLDGVGGCGATFGTSGKRLHPASLSFLTCKLGE